MLLLALDTSTRQASIALCSEDELLGEYSWHVGNNHSVELLDRIRRLMSECGKTMSELDGVAVARGPGSFNGLRVALATAKGLAFALNRPLVGMSTLDVIAAELWQWQGPICAVLEAGRSELYAACYIFDSLDESGSYGDNGVVIPQMLQLSDYLLDTPQHLAAYLLAQANDWFGIPGERQLPPFLFCGELSTASREALYAHMQGNGFFVPEIAARRHAGTLAMLALQRFHDGTSDDPLLLEPLYLRRPSITTSTRKQGQPQGMPLHGHTGDDSKGRPQGSELAGSNDCTGDDFKSAAQAPLHHAPTQVPLPKGAAEAPHLNSQGKSSSRPTAGSDSTLPGGQGVGGPPTYRGETERQEGALRH
jgi:tRNA threonylcarbamoyladenosine biosynthesis protein TsaB